MADAARRHRALRAATARRRRQKGPDRGHRSSWSTGTGSSERRDLGGATWSRRRLVTASWTRLSRALRQRAAAAIDAQTLDQLEEDHLGRVRPPRAELDDPRVAAGTLRVARRDLLEQLVDDELVVVRAPTSAWRRACRSPRLASVISFSNSGLTAFAFGLGGLDPLVLDQLLREVAKQRLAVRRVAAQLVALLRWCRIASLRPDSRRLVLRAARGRARAGSR